MLRACRHLHRSACCGRRRCPASASSTTTRPTSPGRTPRGTNFISTADGIYVACKDALPARSTRRPASSWPSSNSRRLGTSPRSPRWGHLNVAGDFLVGTADPRFTAELEKQAKSIGKGCKLPDGDLFAASRYLAVLDRHTGKVLWTATARDGFRHNTICAGDGRLFAIDRVVRGPAVQAAATGENPVPPRVVAWDLATGKELWHDDSDTFGTWL